MNKLKIFLVAFVVVGFAQCKNNETTTKQELIDDETKNAIAGQINIYGSEAMYALVKTWGDEFMKIHDKVIVNVSIAKTEKEYLDALSKGRCDFAMLTHLPEKQAGVNYFEIPIAQDAVVAIFNRDNPDIQNIINNGLSKQHLIDIFISGKISIWEEIYKAKTTKSKINLLKLSKDNGASKTWADFLESSPDNIHGTEYKNDNELINALKKDPNAIGYVNLSFAYDNYTRLEHSEFKIVPIDFSGNALIDDTEFFYHNKDRFLDAIKDKRYANPPGRKVYLLSKEKPGTLLEKSFLKWIFSTGKNYVKTSGFALLDESEIKESIERLK